MTVVQSASGIRTSILGIKVDRVTSALPATGDLSIFTVSGGRIIVTSILGEVTTVIQAQACAVKIKSVPTTGTTKDISATFDVNALEAGGLISLDGTTLATTLSGTNAGAALASRGSGIFVPIGAIKYNTAATNTGAIKWSITYIPYDNGAVVVAA